MISIITSDDTYPHRHFEEIDEVCMFMHNIKILYTFRSSTQNMYKATCINHRFWKNILRFGARLGLSLSSVGDYSLVLFDSLDGYKYQ